MGIEIAADHDGPADDAIIAEAHALYRSDAATRHPGKPPRGRVVIAGNNFSIDVHGKPAAILTGAMGQTAAAGRNGHLTVADVIAEWLLRQA